MNNQDIQNLLAFLSRVTLKAEEANIFVELVNKIKKLAEEEAKKKDK